MLKQRNPSSRNPRRRFAAPGISVEYCLFRWSAADNSPSDSVEAFADQAGAVAHFLLGDRERRRDAERRVPEQKPVAQDPRLLEQFHDAVEFLRFAQFDRQQQSAAADFTHGGMVALSVFGTLAVIDDRWMSALLAFTTVGVLLPFFFYNVFGNADRGRKIFMGDTGSLTLGYILSFLAVQYTMNTYEAGINYEGAILISFSVLLVPCLDVVRVVLGRVRRGKDPFMPDKTHIHHKFLAMGFTPRKAMISILCISFLFCASNVFLVSYLNNTVLFLCDVAVWTLMNLYISKLISRRNISQI